MLFSDPIFFAFFGAYFLVHVVLPPQWRLWLIVVGSAIFYGWWRPDYLWVPFALTSIVWLGASWVQSAGDQKTKNRRLTLALLALFAPLVVVKYAHFIAVDLVGRLIDISGLLPDPNVLKFPLPLGISFITFTLTAYLVDVWRGKFPLEKRADALFGYVLFFPHLIAGPILRPKELIPQLKQMRRALDARFKLGLAIFTLGLVKKLVFADQLAQIVDKVFAPGATATGWEYMLAIYAFSVQIYCDFSGYTDMAIGLAYLLRVRLPTNFLRPYSAASIVEFWRRWHVTLSHWLRDYLYIALGGNRGGELKRFRNLMITMVLGGLWHGANWTFVIWGFLHGLMLGVTHSIAKLTSRHGMVVPRWLGVFLTFQFVTFAWIFFRAPNVSEAARVIAGPLTSDWGNALQFMSANAFLVVLLTVFGFLHRFDRHALLRYGVNKLNPAILWPLIGFLWILAVTLSHGSSAKFIYFDF